MSQYIDFRDKINYQKIRQLAQIIKDGGIGIFPTETVYGLGVNGLDENAIKKLYDVKKRPMNKPVSLLVNSVEMIEEITRDITNKEYDLIKRFMPGPLTIVLKKKNIVPNILSANLDTVGIRMPENEIALKLIEYAGIPIATSSANISGESCILETVELKEKFNSKVDFFIDGGKSKIGVASTVVQIIDGVPHILREGSISVSE